METTQRHNLSKKDLDEKKKVLSGLSSTESPSKTKKKTKSSQPIPSNFVTNLEIRDKGVEKTLTKPFTSTSENESKEEPPAEKVPIPIKKVQEENTVPPKNNQIKVKTKNTIQVDFTQEKLPLNTLYPDREFLKFLGVTTKNRVELFASNQKFRYFLELGSNLYYIATSILSGQLDRMLLTSPEGEKDEVCFFLCDNEFIYMVYGDFPDKKAAWLLNQMRLNLHELIQDKNPENMKKFELYNVGLQFRKRAKFILEEYIKLQSVFTDKALKSLDKFLRIDYFGLSYQSIGVISKIITDKLEFSDLPPMPVGDDEESDEDPMQEIKESLLTAKVEAIAANTVANTNMMPNWISVKLGFQHYRYILFSKIKTYYISLLAEGNLVLKEDILKRLHKKLKSATDQPFFGDLGPFSVISDEIVSFLKDNVSKI